MAIYRRSSRRPLVITAVVVGVVAVIVGFAVGRATAPDLTSQIRAARAQVQPISTSLEVIRTEYPKLLAAAAGTDAGGAPDAIARARTTFTTNQPTWSPVDPATTAALGADLTALANLITQRASEDDVDSALDAAEADANKLAGAATPT
jgi:hypothetical protein